MVRLKVMTRWISSAALVACLLACSSDPEATGTASSATTTGTPGCTRDATRDAICVLPAGGGFAAEALHAYTCPTDGTPTGVLYARSADGCGDPVPTASKLVALICCP